jgi:hypothetical protein
VRERAHVVPAQVLHVEHGEAPRLEDTAQRLPERGRVGPREDPALRPRIEGQRTIPPDEVEQPATAPRLQPVVDEPAEVAVALDPDVLEHPDRDEDVEGSRQVPEVVLYVPHAIGEAFALRALSCVVDLLPRYVAGDDASAVLEGHVPRERAPAAARLQHAVAGLQPELAAHIVELGPLGLLQGQRRGLEVGAGVDQLVVEPQPVEVVAEVVVVLRLAASQALDAGRDPPRRRGGLRPPLEDGLEASGQASPHLDLAGGVGVAEEAGGIQGEAEERAQAAHDHGRARGLGRQVVAGAVPQLQPDRHLSEKASEAVQHPREEALDPRPLPFARPLLRRRDIGEGGWRKSVSGHVSSVSPPERLQPASASDVPRLEVRRQVL